MSSRNEIYKSWAPYLFQLIVTLEHHFNYWPGMRSRTALACISNSSWWENGEFPLGIEKDYADAAGNTNVSKRNIIVLYLITSMGCTPKVEYQIWINFAFYTFKVGKDHLGEEEENTVVESDTYRSKRATWSINSMMHTCLEQWWTC
ncbi:3809_t:CDS:2 [Funneliformis mosseae]|uniref:3809_t:CDS:1 n=1 Tax=Funneliformis mosseae TaxID=27381 RepID=A0A9N9D6S4_FUNMO|nr:3809_t:CDS:2 [Funneliformis mosseae]